MSEQRFLEFLQALLTMVNPASIESRTTMATTLRGLVALVDESGMSNSRAWRTMHVAVEEVDELIDSRDDFAGRPGQVQENHAKRVRLAHMLRPHC